MKLINLVPINEINKEPVSRDLVNKHIWNVLRKEHSDEIKLMEPIDKRNSSYINSKDTSSNTGDIYMVEITIANDEEKIKPIILKNQKNIIDNILKTQLGKLFDGGHISSYDIDTLEIVLYVK